MVFRKAELCFRGFDDRGGCGLRLAQVCLDDSCGDIVDGSQLLYELLGGFRGGVAGVHTKDIASFSAEMTGDGGANASRCTRDDDEFVLKDTG